MGTMIAPMTIRVSHTNFSAQFSQSPSGPLLILKAQPQCLDLVPKWRQYSSPGGDSGPRKWQLLWDLPKVTSVSWVLNAVLNARVVEHSESSRFLEYCRVIWTWKHKPPLIQAKCGCYSFAPWVTPKTHVLKVGVLVCFFGCLWQQNL